MRAADASGIDCLSGLSCVFRDQRVIRRMRTIVFPIPQNKPKMEFVMSIRENQPPSSLKSAVATMENVVHFTTTNLILL